MLDFFAHGQFLKKVFYKGNKQKKFMNPNLTLFIIIIVIIIIIIQIIYFHCVFFFDYHLNHNMNPVIPVMTIFLAEVLSLSWSTFILIRNKEIKFIN